MEWNEDYEKILNSIRINSVEMSRYYRKQYYKFKSYLKFFRIPIIVLSSCNSVLSVSLGKFIDQDYVSIVTCLISLSCGIIGSIELFLQIQSQMETAFNNSRDFYILNIDIYKMLSLNKEHRGIEQKKYLEDSYNVYCKLIENACPVKIKIPDSLCSNIPNIYGNNIELKKKKQFSIIPSFSSFSNNSIQTPSPAPSPAPSPSPSPSPSSSYSLSQQVQEPTLLPINMPLI